MSGTPRDINALVGSRICHDLISPLGAIGNGLELLTMSGAGAAPEIALIAESVESANARIRFFRVAFGGASPGQGLGAREVRAILADLLRGGRLSVDWQPEGDCLRAEVKLAFLVVLCLESSMPWGGRITIGRSDGHWRILGAAERMKVDESLWAVVRDPEAEAEMTSASVHFALAGETAARLKRAVGVEIQPALISVTF